MYYTTFDNDDKIEFNKNNIHNLPYENIKELYLDKLDNYDFIKKCIKLEILDLYNNNLSNLDKDIFSNLTQLQKLYLSENNLTELNKHIFKYNTLLQKLFLDNNKLIKLDKHIFKYNTQLRELYLCNNKLTQLDKDIFKYNTQIQMLWLHDNKLRNIPISIINCRRLTNIYYGNNEINYIPPNIQNFLNRLTQRKNTLQVYNDSQNVHNHSIQECIKTSLENILNIPKNINKDSLIQDLLESNISQKSIQLLLEYCQDYSVHSVLNITFKEALLHTLEFINLHCNDNKNEIYCILDQEIQDSECKCFTGRISRLINCLNGFTDIVEIKIPDNMAISNIIVMIKQNFKGETEEELKDEVKKALLERGYDEEIINEYLEYIEI
jgi:Leucine-rich repeat (LRR) protein